MLNKRPHILAYSNGSVTEPYQDENGDWVVTEGPGDQVSIPCRAEPNGSGEMVRSEDGASVVFSWLVFADHDVAGIPFGTEVTLSENGVEFGKETVKLFHRGSKISRIWL